MADQQEFEATFAEDGEGFVVTVSGVGWHRVSKGDDLLEVAHAIIAEKGAASGDYLLTLTRP